MGLGKTLMGLALIHYDKNFNHENLNLSNKE
jgi:hypothetical protein